MKIGKGRRHSKTTQLRMGISNLHNPEKEVTVHFISDFRKVDEQIVRTPFLIPKIPTILEKNKGIYYATALYLSMGYYMIRLDPDTHKNM